MQIDAFTGHSSPGRRRSTSSDPPSESHFSQRRREVGHPQVPQRQSTVRLPLEAETKTIRVMEEELFHSVWRNRRLFHVESVSVQVRVHGINVGTSEKQSRVVVGCDPARIGSRRALVRFVSGIQHQVYMVQLEPNPVVVWCGCVRIGLDNLEPEDIAIELAVRSACRIPEAAASSPECQWSYRTSSPKDVARPEL